MNQLFALAWLKWTLFRNAMRSRKAAAGRAAAAAGGLVALVTSLATSAALGFGTYAVLSGDALRGNDAQGAFLFLLLIFVVLYLMWAVVPLGLGGGSQFDAGRLLLYPISLRKLFMVDLLSELTGLAAIFGVPISLGVALGAGAAHGDYCRAVIAGLFVAAFGVAFAKLLATAIGSLMRRKRTSGETALALLGAVLGLSGVLFGQLAPLVERHGSLLSALEWTPPGAASLVFAEGLRAGGAGAYAQALVTLAVYAGLFVVLSYRIARRTALGIVGSRRRPKRHTSTGDGGRDYAGWRLPLVSAQVSAIVEKELRYAVRNAQLRVVALMAVGITLAVRLMPFGGRGQGGGWETPLGPYAEGAGATFSVLYVFTLTSPLTTNVFGYDGAGARTLVLAPVSRSTLLFGKNLAAVLVTLPLSVCVVLVNGLFFGDLSWRAAGAVTLSFVAFAAQFALFGNWLSLRFPKRMEFGKSMGRSGVAGLLVVPFLLAVALQPGLAVLVAYLSASRAAGYAILAASAAASIVAYALLLRHQGRELERRELQILDAVTGRSGEADGRIIG